MHTAKESLCVTGQGRKGLLKLSALLVKPDPTPLLQAIPLLHATSTTNQGPDTGHYVVDHADKLSC